MKTRITARARAQRLPGENGKALKPNVTGHPNELSGHRKAARRRRRDSIARRPRLRKNQPASHACVPVSNITVTGQSWIWQSRDATADTRYERRQQYTILTIYCHRGADVHSCPSFAYRLTAGGRRRIR